MLISTGNLKAGQLNGWHVVITGAGGGIGFEAARALIWLGANVTIAEINRNAGRNAIARLDAEFCTGSACFIQTDVGSKPAIRRLVRKAKQRFGPIDAVINNATLAPLGAVADTSIELWDSSYRVNLRGPVLLARACLPGMLKRGCGIFMCVSSLGTAYMGPYESMKAAQVHLGNTLSEELKHTNIHAFTIGPGYVPTATASQSLPKLADMMGIAINDLQDVLKANTISVEAAGAGFAAALAMAERYDGQEISSTQALIDADIDWGEASALQERTFTPTQWQQIADAANVVHTTLDDHVRSWEERNVFERQWCIRTFSKRAGLPAEGWLDSLRHIVAAADAQNSAAFPAHLPDLGQLAEYYGYLYDMAQGYIKDADERESHLAIVHNWRNEVDTLHGLLSIERPRLDENP